jgi:PhzF family phenazine biosynthesis protein
MFSLGQSSVEIRLLSCWTPMADRQMQAIAKEFNYSETSFVRRPSSAQHTAEIRIFTPSTEVPFRPDSHGPPNA